MTEFSRSVVLASASPRRRDLLAGMGIVFTIIKPDIDETQHPGEPPMRYVRRLSQQKASAVAGTPGCPAAGFVIAADTIVIDADSADAGMGDVNIPGDILGKPADPTEAQAMLRRLRGRAHTVCTAVTLARIDEGTLDEMKTGLAITRVIMRSYTDDEITAYIATGDPFDKAGGYAIQHADFHPVAHIEGDYENVVGLPTRLLADFFAQMDHFR